MLRNKWARRRSGLDGEGWHLGQMVGPVDVQVGLLRRRLRRSVILIINFGREDSTFEIPEDEMGIHWRKGMSHGTVQVSSAGDKHDEV
jgi:hypothetical protein